MAFQGMDPSQVARTVEGMRAQANRLEQIAHAVDNLVNVAAHHWDGAEAADFHQWWVGQHRPRLVAAVQVLNSEAANVQRQVNDQTQASGSGSEVEGHHSDAPSFNLPGVAASGIAGFLGIANLAGVGGDVFDTMHRPSAAWSKVIPHGSYLSAGMKGLGLGQALSGVANAVRNHDLVGGASSVADAGFTFATAPVSLLWTGLKTETNFFIPLDSQGMDEHLAWMNQRGYSPEQISERYTGVQGFIDLGNDNIERHAPWMNAAADAVMAKPAEWLYNVGIKF